MALISLPAPKIFLDYFSPPGALPGTAQLVMGSTSDSRSRVVGFQNGSEGYSDIRLINVCGRAAGSLSIHICPPGVAAAATNLMLNAFAVAVNVDYRWEWEPMQKLLYPGYQMFIFCSAANVCNVQVIGTDYT